MLGTTEKLRPPKFRTPTGYIYIGYITRLERYVVGVNLGLMAVHTLNIMDLILHILNSYTPSLLHSYVK